MEMVSGCASGKKVKTPIREANTKTKLIEMIKLRKCVAVTMKQPYTDMKRKVTFRSLFLLPFK